MVDCLCQAQRPGCDGEGRRPPDQVSDLVGPSRRERTHDLGGARENLAGQCFLRRGPAAHAGGVIAGHGLADGEQSGPDEHRRAPGKRVSGQVGSQVSGIAIGQLRVTARVAEEPDGLQVQQDRLPADPCQTGRLDGGVVCRHHVESVGGQIRKAGPLPQRRGKPAGRRRHADPEAVVFAYQHQRDRKTLVSGIADGVDRPRSSGVIGRRIAERADHYTVVGPGTWHP